MEVQPLRGHSVAGRFSGVQKYVQRVREHLEQEGLALQIGMDDYKRQQDLIFQQIEEKAKLARQAKAAMAANVMNKKRVQKFIARWARRGKISPEWMAKTMEKALPGETDDDSN
jgi:hypothetical protein